MWYGVGTVPVFYKIERLFFSFDLHLNVTSVLTEGKYVHREPERKTDLQERDRDTRDVEHAP